MLKLGYDEKQKSADKATLIAKTILHIDTLETQGNDPADFHDLYVNQIRIALEEAYRAGYESAYSAHTA